MAKDPWWCKKAIKSVQAAKARSGSYAHLPSRDNVSRCGLQNPKSSKASGDTNSVQDICIPAIYVQVVTLDLKLSIQKTTGAPPIVLINLALAAAALAAAAVDTSTAAATALASAAVSVPAVAAPLAAALASAVVTVTVTVVAVIVVVVAAARYSTFFWTFAAPVVFINFALAAPAFAAIYTSVVVVIAAAIAAAIAVFLLLQQLLLPFLLRRTVAAIAVVSAAAVFDVSAVVLLFQFSAVGKLIAVGVAPGFS